MPPLAPEDILTPEQLAARLQVPKSWIKEKTRDRARQRDKNPLPFIRIGRYIRFDWQAVSEWLREQNS